MICITGFKPFFPDVLIYCNAFQFSENNKAEKKGKFLTLQKF